MLNEFGYNSVSYPNGREVLYNDDLYDNTYDDNRRIWKGTVWSSIMLFDNELINEVELFRIMK